MQIVNRMNRLLNQQQVDTQDRWLVIDPVFMELLGDENSKLVNADFNAAELKNGLALTSIAGFRLYVSSNLPAVGTGAGTSGTANQNANFGVIVQVMVLLLRLLNNSAKLKHTVTLTALLTSCVVCTYMVERSSDLRQS
jgi:hypothetical protein